MEQIIDEKVPPMMKLQNVEILLDDKEHYITYRGPRRHYLSGLSCMLDVLFGTKPLIDMPDGEGIFEQSPCKVQKEKITPELLKEIEEMVIEHKKTQS